MCVLISWLQVESIGDEKRYGEYAGRFYWRRNESRMLFEKLR